MKHPEITVKLVGTDGNAFVLLGKVKAALRANKVSEAEQQQFLQEAMSGDYDNFLQTCVQWVNVK